MTKKDKTTAGILALSLGTFGVHRFYLNQVGLGLVYLFILSACGLSFFVGLIDGIIFLTMTDEAFDKKYNTNWVLTQALYTQPPTTPFMQPPVVQKNSITVEEQLLKLEELFDKGAITFEEYEKRKSVLMRNFR